MARSLVTNNGLFLNRFIRHCLKAGFSNYNEFDNNSLKGVAFSKKGMTSENYYSVSSIGYISVVGTFFYKGVMGMEALKSMFYDFSEEHFCDFRSNLIGNYLVTICKNDCLFVFTDIGGIHYAYYWNNGLNFMVGSSLYEMAVSIDEGVELNIYNILSEAYNACVIDDETIFYGFHRLMGEEYVKYDIGTSEFRICKVDGLSFKLDKRPLEEIVEDAANSYKKINEIIKRNFSNEDIAICITGGVDSRTLLAAFLSSEIKPSFYYGIGNSMLTHTMKGDLEVNKMFSERYNVPLQLMNWKTPRQINSFWDEAIKKYGTMSWLYGASQYVFDSNEAIKQSLVFSGYFGELFRNNSMVEHSSKKSFSVEELYEYSGFFVKGLKFLLGGQYEEYKQKEICKIGKVLSRYLDNDGNLPIEYFSVFEYLRRRHADTFYTNFINQSHYSFLVMAEPDIVKFSCVPIEYKQEYRFMLALMKRLFPDCLKLPFYSRFTWKNYDEIQNIIVGNSQKKSDPKYLNYLRKLSFKPTWMANNSIDRLIARVSLPLYVYLKDKHMHNYEVNQLSIARQLNSIYKKNHFSIKPDSMLASWIARDCKFAIITHLIETIGNND